MNLAPPILLVSVGASIRTLSTFTPSFIIHKIIGNPIELIIILRERLEKLNACGV